jgi:hypothetical protein
MKEYGKIKVDKKKTWKKTVKNRCGQWKKRTEFNVKKED